MDAGGAASGLTLSAFVVRAIPNAYRRAGSSGKERPMRRLLLASSLVAATALAGEKYIGTISASTSFNNSTTDAGFTIPSNQKLSIQCDEASFVRVCDKLTGCTATAVNGVKVAQDALFQTSTPNSTTGAAYVAVLSTVTDGGYSDCNVFLRAGNER